MGLSGAFFFFDFLAVAGAIVDGGRLFGLDLDRIELNSM